MKKIIMCVMALAMLFASPAFSWDVTTEAQLQRRMNEVGFTILNSNRIEKRMIFMVTNRIYSRDRWADVSSVNRTVWLKPTILPYIDSDDELAGILAHQISHGVDTYDGLMRGYLSILTYWVAPNKYDLLADKRAVDYMVNAGYNPLAYIVILNKIMQQYRYDIFSNHTLVNRRMMKIYEYIFNKYPSILADNEYRDNIYYQNFLLISRDNRRMLQNKLESKSTRKLNYK